MIKNRKFLAALCVLLIPPFPHAEGPSSVSLAAEPTNAFPEQTKQQEQLVLETSIADLELKKQLAVLSSEKQRRELESAIAGQKLQAEIAGLQAEIAKLTSQTELAAKRFVVTDNERKNRLATELADQRENLERAKLVNEVAGANLAAKQRELQLKDQEATIRTKELQNQRSEFDLQIAKLNTELDLREKHDLWKNRVNREISYTKEPFKDGVLTISDRRIALKGPIVMDTADNIQDRIDYFNNQSTDYPIFLVIDASPGGSVMAGYKILKAMAGCPAPDYVVVKSFAASMAAGIAALGKKSYAYPNTIILHHQILRGNFGNLTQQKEGLKDMGEWWRCLGTPIAAKMGLTLDDCIKEMYQKSSSGDWKEFGDNSRKLKWVDQIATANRIPGARRLDGWKSPEGRTAGRGSGGSDVDRRQRFPGFASRCAGSDQLEIIRL